MAKLIFAMEPFRPLRLDEPVREAERDPSRLFFRGRITLDLMDEKAGIAANNVTSVNVRTPCVYSGYRRLQTRFTLLQRPWQS